MSDDTNLIKLMKFLLNEVFKLIFSRQIKFIDKFFFFLSYFPKVLFYKLFNCYKKNISLIGGRKFEYFGRHLNLPLDHLISHLNSYLKYYNKSKIIFDVGASFGLFSLYVKYFNPKAKIYSFEPAEEAYRLAKKNLSGIKNVYLSNFAISNKESEGRIMFNDKYPESSYIVNQVCDDGQKIKKISLDKFIEENNTPKIDLLKIDTEGHELKVLEGAKNTLKITEKIIIETDVSDNGSLIEILKLLDGFTLENFGDINRDGNKIKSTDLIFVKNHH